MSGESVSQIEARIYVKTLRQEELCMVKKQNGSWWYGAEGKKGVQRVSYWADGVIVGMDARD